MIAPVQTYGKGNLYRVNHDHPHKETPWTLFRNSGNFHEYEKYGELYFE